MSTEPRWRGLPMEEALALRDPPSAIARALAGDGGLGAGPARRLCARRGGDAHRGADAVPGLEDRDLHRLRVGPRAGERDPGAGDHGVRDPDGLHLLLLSRRAWSRSLSFQRESAELRPLNARLQREIAEREKVQKDLEVAEQTLAQSSKLAALGEMSAAVSHELNQPLAAMKTYLAGARLLLQRKRPEEALSSFQRIDDLIERMGAITRQLKSYARKGGEAFEAVDLRACVSSALVDDGAAVEGPRRQDQPGPAARAGDGDGRPYPAGTGDHQPAAQRAGRDQGHPAPADRYPPVGGRNRDADACATTATGSPISRTCSNRSTPPRNPAKGVGLGLAISSGIVTDLGGRLTARNGDGGGAVFEMQLPILGNKQEAAE